MSVPTRVLLLAAVLFQGSALAQKIDIRRAGPSKPPVIDASEDTPINYTGVVPAGFAGALDADDSTYNRGFDCGNLSNVGTAAAYDTITITNGTVAAAGFVVTSSLVGGGACGDSNDTFFTLYDGTFNPASPLTNCLAVNDDISVFDRCSSLSFSIPAGQTRVLVVAGFSNAALPEGQFPYQISFGGTTPVELTRFSAE